jgi:hypothetical protein
MERLMVKARIDNESKEEKFKRIATSRTNKLLKAIRLLANCSNTSVYSYSQDDVRKIFAVVDKELRKAKDKFDDKVEEFKL